MEITVDIDKEKEIRKSLLQADWMQGILNNPRYIKMENLINARSKYIQKFINCQIQVEYDGIVDNYKKVELIIYDIFKMREDKFNINEFALYWAVKRCEHIILHKTRFSNKLKITFYQLDFFNNLYEWRYSTVKGTNIDIFELMARMRKYKQL